MKYLACCVTFSLIIACGNSNSAGENKIASNSSTENKEPAPVSSTAGNEAQTGIVGEWELVGSVIDKNDNLKIDEEERKDLKSVSYKDYMKLNSDGSGLFTVAKMEGRYEAKAKESGGKNYLTWYDSANGPHKIGTIISITKEELHIKEPGGSGLFIWKRL